jgi:hypothetical protein
MRPIDDKLVKALTVRMHALRLLAEMQSDGQGVVVGSRDRAVDPWLVGANGSPRENPINGPSGFEKSICRRCQALICKGILKLRLTDRFSNVPGRGVQI